ncbi:hypothetical protein O4G76_07595 [Limimaricola sp. G21655-S1]|uniref:hypothetical protein n=1 Tax=unclassified Limimaricola TaxID=2626459 RepID=UPI0022AF9C93|nr:hypothetical protein [Limimaricola sp. G21655-S1]MCZ4260702.1 hypothetical protein [Limimaricola sp. G21655-S1]
MKNSSFSKPAIAVLAFAGAMMAVVSLIDMTKAEARASAEESSFKWTTVEIDGETVSVMVRKDALAPNESLS